ncbi:MAG: hypothetical protein R3D63_06475 [Paracoccaceae bacterium]
MSVHQTSFEQRIARINSGQAFTKATVYVGQELSFSYQPRHRHRGGLGQTVSNLGYVMSVPLCLVLGFLAHGLEQLATFAVAGLPDAKANLDIEMVRMAVGGLAITVVLAHLAGLRDKGLMLPKLLGVVAGMLFMHNFVHLYPQVFERIFSPVWVAKVTTMTEAHSIYWRGISIPF